MTQQKQQPGQSQSSSGKKQEQQEQSSSGKQQPGQSPTKQDNTKAKQKH